MTVIAVADAGDAASRRSAFRSWKATRQCCNSWPAGISWCRSAWPWGSISTRPQRARKIGNEFVARNRG